MEYQLNLGAWNSVFVVPSILVDQHIKLAGAVQLKVILWVLRHRIVCSTGQRQVLFAFMNR